MPNWSFIDHITRHLSRPRFPEQHPPTLWPSEASAIVPEMDTEKVVGACRRSTFFRYLLAQYDFDPSRYRNMAPLVQRLKDDQVPPDVYMRYIWAQGELYEQYLVDKAKESGVFVATQVRVFVSDLNLSGKIDLVVLNPETGGYSSIEAKSVYSYGGDAVLGTDAQRAKGQLGEPRDSNLMQIALYDYHYTSRNDQFEHSRLTYGDRGTGRYAEYDIRVDKAEDGLHYIRYRGATPNETEPVTTPISVESIHDQYRYVAGCIETGNVPERDYQIQYSEEKIERLYLLGKLNKTDTTQHEKWKQRQETGGRSVKPVQKGDWQCAKHCQWRRVCYGPDGTPNQL